MKSGPKVSGHQFFTMTLSFSSNKISRTADNFACHPENWQGSKYEPVNPLPRFPINRQGVVFVTYRKDSDQISGSYHAQLFLKKTFRHLHSWFDFDVEHPRWSSILYPGVTSTWTTFRKKKIPLQLRLVETTEIAVYSLSELVCSAHIMHSLENHVNLIFHSGFFSIKASNHFMLKRSA